MRLVESENTSPETTESESDVLEMHSTMGRGTEMDAVKRDTKSEQHNEHHTDEYWKDRGQGKRSDWVKEEEVLNRGHRASESFAVLNELVVVKLPPLGLLMF